MTAPFRASTATHERILRRGPGAGPVGRRSLGHARGVAAIRDADVTVGLIQAAGRHV